MAMKIPLHQSCLLAFFFYLVFDGCADPHALITPTHLTSVPGVRDLQASVGTTPGGRHRVLLTWQYDSLNRNIRSWDIQRSVNDSAVSTLSFFDFVRVPDAGGYPFFV